MKPLLTLLALPPTNLLLVALFGLIIARAWPRLARWLVGLAVAGLFVFSLPVVSQALIGTLQRGLPHGEADLAALAAAGPPPGAIIVLSANTSPGVAGGILPEPGIGSMTLERLEAGAILARRLGLPLLLSGGVLGDTDESIAGLMGRTLKADFGIAPGWIEPHSADTWQNAANSAAILRAAGISRAYVVSNAWHLPRTLIAFRAAGFDVIPAPSRYDAPPRLRAEDFTPHIVALQKSYYAFHEWLGCLWYGLRAGSAR